MNHQPYNDWLLSDDPLSADQTQSFQDHLDSCEHCSQIESSWKELELVIQKTSQVEPASGFTERWQNHLADYRYHQQQRKGWLTISVTALIVTFFMFLLITQLWSLIHSPEPYLLPWLNQLVSVLSIYYILHEIARSFSWYIPAYYLIGIVLLMGIISFMSVLWLSAYRKFSLARRVV